MRSKPKTPRADAGEKADLRFYRYRTAASAEIAVPLRCRETSKPVGPSDPRRPARPRTFSSAHRPKTRMQMLRENDGGCVDAQDRSS